MKNNTLSIAWLFLICLFVSCHSSRTARGSRNVKVELNNQERLIAGRIFPSFVELNNAGASSSANFYKDQKRVAAAINDRYESAVQTCEDGECLARAFIITREEIRILSQIIISTSTDKNLPTQNLEDGIKTINYIFDTYLGGKKPRYPKIDGASFATDDIDYLNKVKKSVRDLRKRNGAREMIYGLPWLTALKLLELNGRDEAGRYEPLAETNKAAYKTLASTEWNKYDYSAILVPGLGPQTLNISLDPGGAKRCDMAAVRFRKGEAPFIIVSGGHVHPDKTPYSEAVEMKNFLVAKHKIPAEAIIVEPYARHTTTNIRNASRLVFTLNMPSKKPVLVVTDFFQTTYIPMMKSRFMDELGYLPYKEISKSKTGGISFIPDISSLRVNPLDPLDP